MQLNTDHWALTQGLTQEAQGTGQGPQVSVLDNFPGYMVRDLIAETTTRIDLINYC